MSSGQMRRPQVEIVPVLMERLEVEAVTPVALASTYGSDPQKIETALCEAESAGYVIECDGLYELTLAGLSAASTRSETPVLSN